MSAPETNVEKQADKHRTPLFGMAAVVTFALLLLFALYFWVTYEAEGPDGAAEQIDGRTGEVVETD